MLGFQTEGVLSVKLKFSKFTNWPNVGGFAAWGLGIRTVAIVTTKCTSLHESTPIQTILRQNQLESDLRIGLEDKESHRDRILHVLPEVPLIRFSPNLFLGAFVYVVKYLKSPSTWKSQIEQRIEKKTVVLEISKVIIYMCHIC